MIRLPASVPYLAVLGVAAGLLLGSGCASRPDWIEATLVTVDVTGRWHGTWIRAGGGGSDSTLYVDLALDQSGASVVGTIRTWGPPAARLVDGPLEGSVAGDILRFERAGSSSLRGEATVDGDKMTGYLVGVAALMPEGRLFLQRVDRATSPPVQRP
jgi:hypothetical protein